MIGKHAKNRGALLVIMSGICNALGQFFWKISDAQINCYMLIGFLFFGIGGLFMIVGLKYDELSNLHSLMGISYVVAFAISVLYFHEVFTVRQIIGCIMILVGVVCLGIDGGNGHA